jgi:hypothetical protein
MHRQLSSGNLGETHAAFVHPARMKKKADPEVRPPEAVRLAQARVAANFAHATDACNFFGWVYDTYVQHESGTRGLRKAVAKKYANAYKVSEGWLLTGEGRGPSKSKAPPEASSEPIPAAASGEPLESESKALKDIQHILEGDRSQLQRLAEAAIEFALVGLDIEEEIDRRRLEKWARAAVQSFLVRQAQQSIRQEEAV